MTTKVAERIGAHAKAFIVEAIRDIVSDPDFGLELTERAKERLQKVRSANGITISLAEIKNRDLRLT